MDRQDVLNMLQMSTMGSMIRYYEDPETPDEEAAMLESAIRVAFEDIIANVPAGEA